MEGSVTPVLKQSRGGRSVRLDPCAQAGATEADQHGDCDMENEPFNHLNTHTGKTAERADPCGS